MFRTSVVVFLLLSSVCAAGPFLGRIMSRPRCVGGTCQGHEAGNASSADPGDESALSMPTGKTVDTTMPHATQPDCQPEITHQAPNDDVPPNLNFGVNWSKIEPHKVTLNGRNITCGDALERIGNQVPDDRNKLRLVVIGTPAEREPVIRAWDQVEQALRDRVSPWLCSAEHWSLRDTTTGDLRYKVDGHPTIYLLGPDGVSLGRMNGFTAAQDVEAIRRAVKKYDADKDVDLRKPVAPKKDDARKTPDTSETNHAKPIAFAVGCGVAALFLLRKGKPQ